MFMRRRARSPLIMLVASLGILLAITAFTTIIFQSAPRPLPEAFGSTPWRIAGANIKPFNVFTIGVAIAGFVALILLLKKTAFGKAVRAIGDDEEVSKVVGINTTVVIAIVFFIGAVYAALAGLLSGHDTAIQPRMGLLLLLKGWIASVVGGIGNMYGAIVGGFVLGLLEQFGIWDLAGEWKDAISFIFLILFLAFWPKGRGPLQRRALGKPVRDHMGPGLHDLAGYGLCHYGRDGFRHLGNPGRESQPGCGVRGPAVGGPHRFLRHRSLHRRHPDLQPRL